MIVKNLSNSFNPVPKIKKEKEKNKIQIKQKSKKLAKLERSRYSMLTKNLDKCYFCPRKKQELHEAFRGRNRQKSIKWGLVVPICDKCHKRITNDKEFSKILEQIAKKEFVKKYGEEKFIEEFK